MPGTGELVWKSLFEAARKFSLEAAYPNQGFPNTDANAVCPLCQQPLKDGAERLNRFEKYIQDDAAKLVTRNRQQVEVAKSKIDRANLAAGLDESLAGELGLLDGAVVSTVRAFEAAIADRRTSMLDAIATHSWENIPSLAENPRQRLRDLAARQLKSARTFKRASDDATKRDLRHQSDELHARKNLAASLDGLLALTARIKLRSALEKCKADLRTKPISDKSKELASKAVSSGLKAALDEEFKSLGIEHIKTKLKERNDKGKMKYRLLLDIPTTHKLEEILSEGEQRALAISSFLAELKLANHSGGIVFDDPVSSLDHWRRQNVVKRLVKEASQRQVVVLTHDTSFLGQLQDELDSTSVSHVMHFLEWRNNLAGHVNVGLPWEHKKYKERIDSLEQAQKRFEKMPWPAYPDEVDRSAMRHQYDLFRATIERVIEDFVFNGVVKRYRDWIRVDCLDEVIGFAPSEHREIERLHKRCCDVFDAHDPSSAKNAAVPTAHDFGVDIEALKRVIAAIRDRRKASKGN